MIFLESPSSMMPCKPYMRYIAIWIESKFFDDMKGAWPETLYKLHLTYGYH
jgi:hypothetical protein